MNFRHSDRPKNVQEILRLIAHAPTGKTLLERFIPAFESGKIQIKGYPLEITEKLRAVLGEGQPIGACFTTDGTQGVIYLDLESPLGVLAPFLVHEISHSLDASLWNPRKRPKSMIETETRAFETQHRFTTELKSLLPGYAEFLTQQFPRAKILHQKLSQMEIAEMYDSEPNDQSA